ncbi:MAG TPA: hypothetical protein VG406_21650 [Isosphaeraceae bacterium]|jgi:plastocyanin|nr:hypothetical protein [Isosphaeraceae bacterium]
MLWNQPWTRRSTKLGLGLGLGIGLAGLMLAANGCGNNKGGTEDTAVVVPPPSEVAAAKESGGGSSGSAAVDKTPSSNPAPEAKGGSSKAEAAPVKAEGWGTLKGQITFDGDPPAPTMLVTKGDKGAKDPEVCAAQNIPSQRLVVDPKTKGIRYAIVYIPNPTAKNPEAVSEKKNANVVFDQRNCTFVPHVLAAISGAKIKIVSTDPVKHNVDSKLQNNKFNQALEKGKELDITGIKERSPGKVVCDIHNWMSAYWLITDSPYFAVTDEQGNYEIKNVPAGTQKVVVWLEAANRPLTPTSGEAVNIKADGETEFSKKLEPSNVRPE